MSNAEMSEIAEMIENDNNEDGNEDMVLDGAKDAPKELKDSDWPAEWPAEWPKLLMSELECKLLAYKKDHKNTLPDEKELPNIAFGDEADTLVPDDGKRELLFKLLIGTKNAEGKLEQGGQKGSVRGKFKALNPVQRDLVMLTFKHFVEECQVEMDDVSIPAMDKFVNLLKEKAASEEMAGHTAITNEVKGLESVFQRKQKAAAARKKRVESFKKEIAKKASRGGRARQVVLDSETTKELLKRHHLLVESLRHGEEKLDMETALGKANSEWKKWHAEAKEAALAKIEAAAASVLPDAGAESE